MSNDPQKYLLNCLNYFYSVISTLRLIDQSMYSCMSVIKITFYEMLVDGLLEKTNNIKAEYINTQCLGRIYVANERPTYARNMLIVKISDQIILNRRQI